MSQETVQQTPALAASQNSWRCVHAHDKEGWLALMADDVVDRGPDRASRITNPDGNGVRGKEGARRFTTTTSASPARVTCEETFPSSSPDEIAHILVLRFSVRQRLGKHGARRVHLQRQRRRPADQPARLLEHGHDEVRSGGRGRLAGRWPAAAQSSSAALAASVWRWPSCLPRRARASWSTDVTPRRRRKRRNALPVLWHTRARRRIRRSPTR